MPRALWPWIIVATPRCTGDLLLGAELGVELYKHRYLLVEASARAVAFLQDDGVDAAVHATVGAAVPF